MAINTSIIQTLLKQTFNKDIEVTMGDWYNTPTYNFYINGGRF